MLVGCFACGGANVFAYTKDAAPAVSLGESFALSAPVVKIDDDFDVDTADIYYARFTPDAADYYEFVFSKNFSGGEDEGMITGIYSYKSDDFISSAICATLPAEYKAYADYLGITNNPSVAGKLKAGEDYALVVINATKKTFSANVTIQSHTHTFKTFTQKSHVDSDSMSYNTDGEKYTGCTVNNCPYHKTVKRYYSVKSVKLSKTKYTYSGKVKKPAVTVKDRKGYVLKKGRDYTVSYSKNKAIGTAKVTVRFKGNYEGKVVRKFKINPKGTSLSKVYARRKGFYTKWKKQTTKTTGYQIQYSTSKKFTKKTSETVDKKVNGKKYYSAWSKAKTVTTRK